MNDVIHVFFKHFKKINDYYKFLINKTKQASYVGITNEWIIDNFYLLVEAKTDIVNDRKVLKKRLKNTKTLYYFLRHIASVNNYNIPFNNLVSELKKYQHENNVIFSYREIMAIKTLLLFIYTEKLYSLCIDLKDKMLIQAKINKTIESVDKENISLNDLLGNNFDYLNDQYYIYELNQQLNKLGDKSNSIFKEINEILKSKDISLKEIINEYYQEKVDNNILISNIGPKIFVKLQYVRDILYELRTKVSNYGINSMLVELYLDFNIKSSVFFFKEDEFETNYSILLSSKVVSGQVPSIYGNTFEKQSEKENI